MRFAQLVSFFIVSFSILDSAEGRLSTRTRTGDVARIVPFGLPAGFPRNFPFSEEGQLAAEKFDEHLVPDGEEATIGVGHIPDAFKVAEELAAKTRAAHGMGDNQSKAPTRTEPPESSVLRASSPRSVTQRVDENNQTISIFGTCNEACDQCFLDHYQGCLATCEIGCEDYCAIRLPASECLDKQRWTANVGHVFQVLNISLRMCRATGFNGCPEPPRATIDPHQEYNPPPFDPYTAVSREEDGSNGHKAIDPLDEQEWNQIAHGPNGPRPRWTSFSSVLRGRK